MSKQLDHQPLQWSDALETGSDLIDKQHKILIGILNDANRCFRDNSELALQRKVIDDLISYTVYHFDTEEELMEKGGYGDSHSEDELSHIREHRTFTGKVAEYLAAIRQGNTIDHEQVFSFLNSWLVNHVLGTDKRLGAYLQANRKSTG